MQACTNEDLPTNLTRSCDKLPKGITLPDEISDDDVNKSMSLLGQLKNATAGSLQLVDDNRHAFNACQNSTVSNECTEWLEIDVKLNLNLTILTILTAIIKSITVNSWKH